MKVFNKLFRVRKNRILELKEREKELVIAKEKAEESDRLKTAFLHNISHEIRTPMNAIVGFSSLLGEPDADDQARQSYIEVIMQSSNHLLAIINDIVNISHIEANLVKLALNELNINSLLQLSCKLFLTTAHEKNLNLFYESSISDSDSLILADNSKLTQIISNLINNALKFTDKGYIKIVCNKNDNFLEISVSDTGIGIHPEQHKKIFDRFYQVQNMTSRSYEGTGLGLSISKAYIDLMGGKIWLDSVPGIGTTFHFTVPYKKSDSAIAASSEIKISEKPASKNKKTILIAEDIESNFMLLSYILSDSNVELLRAVNGREAVEMCLSKDNIDLVLMDIKMPVMDGYMATKIIRESRPAIPIIAQTVFTDDLERAIECGCNGFISKPFNKKQLLKIMAEFI